MDSNTKGRPSERPLLIAKVKSYGRAEEHVTVTLAVFKSAVRLYFRGELQRELPLDCLDAITYSATSSQFVLHAKTDIDERFSSSVHRRDIIEMILYLLTATGDNASNKVKFFVLRDRCLGAFVTTEEDLEDGHILRPETQYMQLIDHKRFLRMTKEDCAGLLRRNPNPKKVTVEDFELLKLLGRGAHGKVLLCSLKSAPESRYAMKILKKKHIVDAKQLEHTIAEKAILSRMNHPFLVSMKFNFQSDSKLYFVMEFMQGGELFQHLKRVSCFSENQAKFICACLVLALGHLHNSDYIYRDLKPENILFDERGFAKLSDFGLAKQVTVGSVANTFCGTPEYLAPEVILNKGCNRPADWWSLGILVYELLFGSPPFYSTDIQEMYKKTLLKPLKFPSQTTVSRTAMDFVTGLLVKAPKDRLGSVADSLEVMNHPWFADVCWSSLLAKQVNPPYKPFRTRWENNFDPEFIRGEARDSSVASFIDIPEDCRRKFEQMNGEKSKETIASESRRTLSASNLGKLFRDHFDAKRSSTMSKGDSESPPTESDVPQQVTLALAVGASKTLVSLSSSLTESQSMSEFDEEEQAGQSTQTRDTIDVKMKAIEGALTEKGMFRIVEEKACDESSPQKTFESASDVLGEIHSGDDGRAGQSPIF